MRSGEEFRCAFWDTRLPATSSSGTLPNRYAAKRACGLSCSRELLRLYRHVAVMPCVAMSGRSGTSRRRASAQRCEAAVQ